MKRWRFVFICLLTFCFSSAFCQYAASSWPCFHQNNNHIGVAAGGGSNGALKWTYLTKQGAPVTSSPVTGPDGTVYVGRDTGLVAIAPNGVVRWEAPCGTVDNAPAVGPDGTIYVGTSGSAVSNGSWTGTLDAIVAIRPTGTLKWSYVVGSPCGESGVALGTDGTVYCSSDNGRMYAIAQSGALKWSFLTSTKYPGMVGAPAIGLDGTIYFGSEDGYVYALNSNGSPKWTFLCGAYQSRGNAVVSPPTVGPDGTLYVNSNSFFYALNSTGHVKWSVALANNYISGWTSSPAIAPDGTIYVGVSEKAPQDWIPSQLYALTPAGKIKWTFWANNGIDSSPAIGGDGTIYFGCMDDNVYAVTPAGQLLWTFTTEGPVESSPAIAGDGTIYIGSDDDHLYAIGTQVTTVPVASVTVNPNSVACGNSAVGAVTLASAAPSVGDVVSLSSSTACIHMQTAVFIPSGQKTATFPLSTVGVGSTVSATITAISGSVTKTASFTIKPATLTGVTATSVKGGITNTGTVNLNGIASANGAVVTLTSSNPSVASVPAQVTIASGSEAASFAITTKAVEATQSVTITASYAGVKSTTSISIYGDAVGALSFSPSTVAGGSSSTGTITLTSAAPTGGWLVNLEVGNPTYVTIPATVTVAAGSKTATFPIKTAFYTQNYTGTITAYDALTTKASVLNVTGDAISSLTLNPTSVLAGNASTATITLKSAAPAGGWVVTISSSSTSAATVPTTVTVAAGATTTTFKVTSLKVATSTTVTIGVTDAKTKATATLTVNPSHSTMR